MPIATAFQTIGPYWHLIEHPEWAVVTGRLRDGDGAPLADGAVELWQASPAASETFPGWGRAATDAEGRFRFTTIRPGPLPGPGNAQQAPHFALSIFARGILSRLVTRVYFAGEPLNETDPVLNLIEDAARRATLLANPAGAGAWHTEIRLQGAGETVFLDF
jgi:protocatechuate 3,4-dioxygenase alpha subunit